MSAINWMLLGAAVFAAGCASAPDATRERGWIGGRLADVVRGPHVFGSGAPSIERDGTVVGMPDAAGGDAAALVTQAVDGTPLSRAGLAAGDLVLSIDGDPVAGALDLRERVEAMAPGSRAHLAFWRAGAAHEADVVVGRETYRSSGTVTIGLALSPTIDLWPFDDGIDILGLLRIRWDHERRDLAGPEAAYLRAAVPGAEASASRQESFDVFVLPFGVGKGKTVIRQETVQ